MNSRIMAKADATAGQLHRLVLEISVTFHPLPRDDTRKPMNSLSLRMVAHESTLIHTAQLGEVGLGWDRSVTAGPVGATRHRRGGSGGPSLAPGMQYDRDNGADGGHQDRARNRNANIGQIFRRFWCLKKLHLAVFAFRRREIYGFSALRTLSFHTSLPPSRVISRPDLLTMMVLNLSFGYRCEVPVTRYRRTSLGGDLRNGKLNFVQNTGRK